MTVPCGEGFVRSLSLSLQVARRQAISEGTPSALVLTRTGGEVTSLGVVRAGLGGDAPTDATIVVPKGVTVTTAYDRWEYDFAGKLIAPVAGGSISVSNGVWTYDLTINALTGHIQFAKAK